MIKFLLSFLLIFFCSNVFAQTSTPILINSSWVYTSCQYTFNFNKYNRTHLWADPKSGLIAQNFRYTTLSSQIVNTGFVAVSFSKNFGANWALMQGPVYWNDAGTGAQGPSFPVVNEVATALYNPYLSSNPDSAYMCYTAVARDNTNPDNSVSDYGGHSYGASNGAQTINSQDIIHSDSVSKFFLKTFDDYFITQDGHSWTIDFSGDQKLQDQYLDTVYCDYGTWDNIQHQFTMSKRRIFAPLTHVNGQILKADARIAFAPTPNTNIGWLSILGHDDFGFDANGLNYFIFYKTTDGGQTWIGPIKLALKDIIGISKNPNDPLYVDSTINPSYKNAVAPMHDLVVDYIGNPHIICSMGIINVPFTPSATKFDLNSRVITFSLTNNLPIEFSGKVLSKQQAFWTCIGNCLVASASDKIVGHNKTQLAINWEGTRVFYAWCDEDTVAHPPINSFYNYDLQDPDLWVAGHNLVDNIWTVNPDTSTHNISIVGKNVTANTAAEGKILFPNVSYYVLEHDNKQFEVPFSYSEFIPLTSGNYNFLDSIHNYYFGANITLLGENKLTQENDDSFTVFPNPSNDKVICNIKNNLCSKDILIKVYNIIGESVNVSITKSTNSQEAIIDISTLPSGSYFVNLFRDGVVSKTKKLVKI